MKLFRDLHYTPRERRRLAREDAGPGRRFPRRVGKRSPSEARPFGRDDIAFLAAVHIPGFRHRHLEIRTPEPALIVVTVRRSAAEIVAFAAALARVKPPTLWAEVRAKDGSLI